MPEVVIRKRVGRRSGDWKYRVNRWYFRNRPKIAVVAAFAVACVLGLVAASMGITSLGNGSKEPDSTPVSTQ